MTEAELLDSLQQRYAREGFRAIDPAGLPGLPHGYVPDLVMARGDEVIVLEVRQPHDPRSLESWRAIKTAVEDYHPSRQFRLIGKSDAGSQPPAANMERLRARVAWARTLAADGDQDSAAAILWMVVEACLRELLARLDEAPHPDVGGMSMARRLHGLGDLTQKDLEILAAAEAARNLAVHGYCSADRAPLPEAAFDLADRLAQHVADEQPVLAAG